MTTLGGKVLAEDRVVEGDIVYFDATLEVFRPIRVVRVGIPDTVVTAHVIFVEDDHILCCPDLRCTFLQSPLARELRMRKP